MPTDYCAIFAEKIRERIGDEGGVVDGAIFYKSAVYDQTNPARVWTGTPTVEIMEADVVRSFYISGLYRNAVKLEIAARTQTRRQAAGAARVFRRIGAAICAALVDDETIESYELDAERVYPDERGKAIGESFYCVIPLTLYEAPKEDEDE